MKKLLSRRILFMISLVAAAVFFIILFQLQMLPLRYYIMVVVGVLAITYLLYRSQKDKYNEHTVRVTIMKLINVLFAIVLVIGSLVAMRGSDFISAITGGTEETIQMNVIVLKDSSYQTIQDLKGKAFGALSSMDAIDANKVETLIEDDIGDITVTKATTDDLSVKALENKEVEALIIRAVDLEQLNDIEEDFEEKIRVVQTYELKIPTLEANSAKVTQETFNVLIVGADKQGKISRGDALSDVNMVASVNPITKQILITSIPRDYYVDLYLDGVNLGKDKLTHSAKKGTQCTQETVEHLLGIEINYYAKFNFTSFMNVVDALGGVTVDIPKYNVKGNKDGIFTTKIYNYTMKPGTTTMDGKHALAFVRERRSFLAGDNIRNRNQMIMLKAIIKKCSSLEVITKIDGVLSSVSDSFATNMSEGDIKSLINMQVDDLASWDVQTYHLEGDATKRATKFATVSESLVARTNKNGLFVMEPYEKSITSAKGYIDIISKGEEILKVEDED